MKGFDIPEYARDKYGNGVIVCDNGTGYIKCGWANSNFPAFTVPSIVGRPTVKAKTVIGNHVIKDLMVGQEAAECRSALECQYPMTNGIVKNWENMTHVWDHVFGKDVMNIDPKTTKVILTEAPMNPMSNREKMLEVMFEHFGFHSVHIGIQAVLALYSSGFQTGVVLDAGDGVSHAIPVWESNVLTESTRKLPIAGRDVTKYLITCLGARGYTFNDSADYETVRQMKERLCYVAHDLKQEEKLAKETTVLVEGYKLPDGRIIKMSAERFQAPEVLFQPHLMGVESQRFQGIAEMVFESINSCSMDLRPDLYKNIMLSGGTTMYPGLPTRLKKDIEQLYLDRVAKGNKEQAKKMKIVVQDPPRRRNMVYLGAAVFGNIIKDHEEPTWITKKMYQEKGAKRIVATLAGQ